MKRAEKAIWILTACVLMTLAQPCLQAKTLPKTAKLLPAEVVLLIDIENFSQMKTQFEKTNLHKLYKDPAMSAFVEDFKAKYKEKICQMDGNNIFRTILEPDVLPLGRAAVALVLNEQTKDSDAPFVLVITQWGENIDKIKESVKKMLEKNIELGGHQKITENYQGVSIETVIYEKSSALNYCFIDDCLIGSMNPDILKFVIAHIKGATSPTLADDTDYNATVSALGPYHDIDIYINIKQILKTTIAADTSGQAQQIIPNLGLDNVVSAGCSIGFAQTAGSNYSGKAILKVNGVKKGILKILEPQSASLKTPGFMPSSTNALSFLNLDIKKAYSELADLLSGLNPMYASLLYMPLLPQSPDGQPGVQLKADIIDHLGSQILFVQSINKPFSKSSAPTETLVALAVTNRNSLEKSLSILHSKKVAANNPDARRELLGHTIYVIDLSNMLPFLQPGMTPMQQTPPQPNTPPIPKLAFTVTDTHLIFGTETSVERAIRVLTSKEAGSVISAKWFTSAKSAIPQVAGFAGLKNDIASMESLWWMAREISRDANKSTDPSMGSFSTGMNPADLLFSQTGLFDFALLPDFDTVSKYFGSSASYGISRPDGFFFEFKDVHTK